MDKEPLTDEQKLHIEIDGLVSDLADLAIQWDDPTDYPSLEVDRTSNQIMELVFTYVDDKFTELIGEDEEAYPEGSIAGQHGLGEGERARNALRAELRKKVLKLGEYDEDKS